jgi:hypothetical protein
MTIRTLVLQRLHFGLEPLAFRRGATRVLSHIAGRRREEARVTVEDLRKAAPIVPPLERARAKRLIGRAGMLAAQINAKWTRNPFAIAMIAVSGSYMSRSRKLPELNLWLIVRPRTPSRASVWGRPSSRGDGARQIRDAVRSLSSYIVVRLVTDAESLPRPFTVAFRADDMPAPQPIFLVLREWSDSIRRRIGKRRSDGRPR